MTAVRQHSDTFAISIIDPDGDPLGAALWRLAEVRDMSGCGKCGSPDPVRIDAKGCSDCTEYPRCVFCRRWTYDHNSVGMQMGGELVDVCDVCVAKGEEPRTPDRGDHYAYADGAA